MKKMFTWDFLIFNWCTILWIENLYYSYATVRLTLKWMIRIRAGGNAKIKSSEKFKVVIKMKMTESELNIRKTMPDTSF